MSLLGLSLEGMVIPLMKFPRIVLKFILKHIQAPSELSIIIVQVGLSPEGLFNSIKEREVDVHSHTTYMR